MTNTMSLTFSALSENEAFARSVVAAFCANLNPTIDCIDEVKTAVSEAVTNCIVHAYRGIEDGIITINAQLDEGIVHIDVIDNGVGIDDIERAKTAFFTTQSENERAGLGFTVMESFMDTLEVKNNPQGGVIVSMSKRLCTGCEVGK